jgi:hypothetical protein
MNLEPLKHMNLQEQLKCLLPPRIPLVSANFVATMRGQRLETFLESVGSAVKGESLMWVFDVSPRMTNKRLLRFWSNELHDPAGAKKLTLEQVVKQLVPRRDAVPGQFVGLRNWEVGDLLRVSNSTLLEMHKELRAVSRDGGIYIPRAALEDFFYRRWIFANTAAKS